MAGDIWRIERRQTNGSIHSCSDPHFLHHNMVKLSDNAFFTVVLCSQAKSRLCNRMALSDRGQTNFRLPRGERRARERAPVGVKGRIFFPARQWEEECVVSDLSPDGAGLKSSCSAAVGAAAVLYVDGLGRFEGKIVRHDRLRLGVKF